MNNYIPSQLYTFSIVYILNRETAKLYEILTRI